MWYSTQRVLAAEGLMAECDHIIDSILLVDLVAS